MSSGTRQNMVQVVHGCIGEKVLEDFRNNCAHMLRFAAVSLGECLFFKEQNEQIKITDGLRISIFRNGLVIFFI
eukprot:2748468-Amphidinium_carterae.1